MHRKSSASKNAATVNLAASPPADAADEEEGKDAAAPSPTPPVVVDHEAGEREKAEAPVPAPFVWCPPLPPFVIQSSSTRLSTRRSIYVSSMYLIMRSSVRSLMMWWECHHYGSGKRPTIESGITGMKSCTRWENGIGARANVMSGTSHFINGNCLSHCYMMIKCWGHHWVWGGTTNAPGAGG